MTSPRDRYRTDPEFATLVNVMRSFIERAQYTPSELREAAILAAIMHEMERPVEGRIELAEDALRALEAERDGVTHGGKKR